MLVVPGEETQKRAARNEDLFRQVNDRLHALAVIEGSSEPLEQCICECEQTDCSLVVELTASEYRSVREHGARFLIFPDASHASLEVETVVERNARYWVVEKQDAAGEEADHLAEHGQKLL